MIYSGNIRKKASKMKKQFQVGQKVICTSGDYRPSLKGKTGIVRHVDDARTTHTGIEFPGWGRGHRLDKDMLQRNDGYYLPNKYLETVELDWDE